MKERKWSRSVVSDSLRPHGPLATRLLCPWNYPGKNTAVGCHFLLQGIFLTQVLNPGLLHCRQILYHRATREALITRKHPLYVLSILVLCYIFGELLDRFLYFFNKFVHFNWRLITSQYCSGFAIHWHAGRFFTAEPLGKPPEFITPAYSWENIKLNWGTTYKYVANTFQISKSWKRRTVWEIGGIID